ncbi:MAG TPA: hypothetical protein VFI03_11530 [Solirubrobacterales bacterium]|nr:hypothetical protein [Solirubrobacterales bacterium]
MFEPPVPNWLDAIAPQGADVLYTNTSILPLTAADWTEVEPPYKTTVTTRDDGSLVHHGHATKDAHAPPRHPTEAPRPEQRVREERIARAWNRAHALALALVTAGVGERGIGRGAMRIAETALWLADGGVREPGVPIFDRLPRRMPGDIELRSGNLLQGKRFGRNGASILRIECAVGHDLVAAPYAQLSKAQQWRGHVDAHGNRGNPSEAKRAVREGRKLLHRLGAWPWAHAEAGRLHLHPGWWTQPGFLDPLRSWISYSWARFLFLESLRARRASELEESSGVPKKMAEASLNVLADEMAQVVIALDADRFLDAFIGKGKQD